MPRLHGRLARDAWLVLRGWHAACLRCRTVSYGTLLRVAVRCACCCWPVRVAVLPCPALLRTVRRGRAGLPAYVGAAGVAALLLRVLVATRRSCVGLGCAMRDCCAFWLCLAVRLSGCPAVWLSDSLPVRLSGCPAVRLSGCMTVCLSGRGLRCLPPHAKGPKKRPRGPSAAALKSSNTVPPIRTPRCASAFPHYLTAPLRRDIIH